MSAKAEIRKILLEYSEKSTIAGLHYAFSRNQVFQITFFSYWHLMILPVRWYLILIAENKLPITAHQTNSLRQTQISLKITQVSACKTFPLHYISCWLIVSDSILPPYTQEKNIWMQPRSSGSFAQQVATFSTKPLGQPENQLGWGHGVFSYASALDFCDHLNGGAA